MEQTYCFIRLQFRVHQFRRIHYGEPSGQLAGEVGMPSV